MAWELNGNNIEDTDFLGTTNALPLVIKIHNREVLRILEFDPTLRVTYGIEAGTITGWRIFAREQMEGRSRNERYASGVYGETSHGEGFGVFGRAVGTGWAGYFEGFVEITGNIRVRGAKNFRIDHPLAPAEKYLDHTCVESSEMKNVYDGVALLDEHGAAWVELPEWFQALNKDFRYQLTAIGGSAAELHVAEEISDNKFRIAGGKAGMKVCWQVSGIRCDPWAEANPMVVEEDKPEEEKGRYILPELYDAPEEQRIMIGPPITEGPREERLEHRGEEEEDAAR